MSYGFAVPVRRALRLTLLLGVCSLASAGAASAATVSVTAGVMTYQADPGHINDVFFDQGNGSGPGFTPNGDVTVTRNSPFLGFGLQDDDALVAGTGCDTLTGGTGTGDVQSVTCHGVTAVTANLGDRDDQASGQVIATSPPIGLETIPITINAGDGNDQLAGGNADDTLNGENGNDGTSFFDGNNGVDHLNGGNGNDGTFFSALDGEKGNDVIDGGSGDDYVADTGTPAVPMPATPGPNDTSNDTITGGDGQDSLNGGPGDDNVDGGDGSDFSLVGGPGTDTVSGGNGDDIVSATEDNLADTYNGGAGNDTIDYSAYGADVVVTLAGGEVGAGGEKDKLANDFENLNGGAGNDTLTGNDADNNISGGSGADTIAGAGGSDSLFGDSGNDTLGGGEGRDFIGGGDGNDTLNGENGDDELQGGSGDDTLNGGAGNDTADYRDRGNNTTVSLDGVANDGQAGEVDNADADKSVENIIAGSGDDTLTGNTAVNFIDSGAGNDAVNAVDGTFLVDVVACGTGYDTATGDPLDFIEKSGPDRCENRPAGLVNRIASKVSAKTSPKSDKKAPFVFTTSGTVSHGIVPASLACSAKDFVIVQVQAGANTISARKVPLTSSCKFKSKVTLHLAKRFLGHRTLKVTAKYSGNKYLKPANSKAMKIKTG